MIGLRVLHVLGELKPSGAETMLVSAAPLFKAEGMALEVLSTGASIGPHAGTFSAAGYRLHHIPFSRSIAFFSKVRDLIKVGRYDIVHLHVESANFWFGLIALSVRSPVVLRTVHASFNFSGNLRWRRAIQRLLLRSLGVTHVSISESVSENERARFGLETLLIPNWYDSQRFTAGTDESRVRAREEFAIGEHDFVIASVGNCSAIKNHAAVLEAIAMLPPERRPLYLHVGIEDVNGSERELARRLGIEDCVRFLGAVSNVLPILRAADAFVMPSLYEGFGIAASEALGVGLPSLLSDVDGLKDFRCNFPQLIYSGTSASDVAEGVASLMDMSDETRQWARQQYPIIANRNFGIERGVTAYLSLYRGMVRR